MEKWINSIGDKHPKQKTERLLFQSHYGMRGRQRADKTLNYAAQRLLQLFVADCSVPDVDGTRIRRLMPVQTR